VTGFVASFAVFAVLSAIFTWLVFRTGQSGNSGRRYRCRPDSMTPAR